MTEKTPYLPKFEYRYIFNYYTFMEIGIYIIFTLLIYILKPQYYFFI